MCVHICGSGRADSCVSIAGGVALLDLAEQHAVFANPEDVEAIDEFIMSSTGVHLILPIYFRAQLLVFALLSGTWKRTSIRSCC